MADQPAHRPGARGPYELQGRVAPACMAAIQSLRLSTGTAILVDSGAHL
jgi:hypothetical protein